MTDKPDDPTTAPALAAMADATARIAAMLETRIAPALERIASALERGGVSRAEAPTSDRADPVTEIRRAIRAGELGLAQSLLADLAIDSPETPHADSLKEEFSAAREVAIGDCRTRLDAARSANDAEAVISYRDELTILLDAPAQEALDREVLSWLMSLLMKRMRTGTVRADVAHLAARIAESFSHRPEGASIRASLPTLRRSAGLCARCSGPYTGIEDACPNCLAGTPKIADLPETPVPST
jgi:hypothetical protein